MIISLIESYIISNKMATFALCLSIGELVLAAANIGTTVTLEVLQKQINDIYNKHKSQLDTLASIHNSMKQLGFGQNEKLAIDIANDYIDKNFQLMNNAMKQQTQIVDNAVKTIQADRTANYQAIWPSQLGIGLGSLGFSLALVNVTKQVFPDFYKNAKGKFVGFGQNFFKSVKTSFKIAPRVVEEGGSLRTIPEPEITATGSIQEPTVQSNAGWWKKLSTTEKIGYFARFLLIAGMIVGVVFASISIHALINKLKDVQDYFGENGTYQKNLAIVQTEVNHFCGFYSSLVYSLRNSVQKMNAMFLCRAFLNRPGSVIDSKTAIKLNYNSFGLNEELINKSQLLVKQFNQIKNSKMGLQDRINSYGPILTTFLGRYKAPGFIGSNDGTATVPLSFTTTFSELSKYIGENGVNMQTLFLNFNSLMMVGRTIHNLILSIRPIIFKDLTCYQKQTIDKDIWGQCQYNYSQLVLNGQGLWPADLECVAGIVMNFCDEFYADDITGKSILKHQFNDFKWNHYYKDLTNLQKEIDSSQSISFVQPTKEEQIKEEKTMINSALSIAMKNINQYPILEEGLKQNMLKYENCKNIKTFMKLVQVQKEITDATGNKIMTIVPKGYKCATFTFHGSSTYLYAIDTLTHEETFKQTL